MERPNETEYAPFYRGYVALVPETEVLASLEKQAAEVRELASGIAPERETYRYLPDKWSIRQIHGHLCDAERVFGYRAFSISRGDRTPLPGFDEKEYVARSSYDRRALSELVSEFSTLRESNLVFLRGLDEEAWTRTGTANGAPVSVRALAFVMVGHVRHHAAVLRERYGVR